MALFSFLEETLRGDEKPGGGVFGFLETVARGGKGEGGGLFGTVRRTRDIAVGAARGAARIPETLVRTSVQAGQDIGERITGEELSVPFLDRLAETGQVTDPVRRLLYGSEPIETYQTRQKGIEKTLGESRFRGAATPLSLLGIGLVAGTDVLPLPSKGSKDLFKSLAKETSEAGVKKLLAKQGIEATDDVVRSIAKSTNQDTIRNLLSGGKSQIQQADELAKATLPRQARPPELEPDEIILYHRTSSDNADKIIKSGKFLSKENTGEVFLSNKRAGQNIGYGDTVIPVRVKRSAIRLDDEFPSGERHYAVKASEAVPYTQSTSLPRPTVGTDITPPTPIGGVAEAAGQGRQRAFLETTQRAEALSPETKQAISEIRPQTYTPKANKELYERAKSIVDTNPQLARERVRSLRPDGVETLDEDVAIGTELLRRANNTKNYEEAAAIVDELTDKGLQYGRAVQAYSMIGRLTPEGILGLASRKVRKAGGQLNPKVTEELSGLAGKLKGLADDDPEKWKITQQIGETISKAVPKSKKEQIWEIFGAPRSLLASSDISGMGRQGLFLGTRFPKQYKDAFKSQVEYFASPEGYKEGMARIAADPDFELISDKMGVALTGASRRPEEQFGSQILESDIAKRLGIGHIVAASDRGYTGALTDFRHKVSKTILDDLRAAGIDPASLPEKQLKDLGWYINIMSGRGGKPGGWLEKNGDLLSKGLFSPQLWASRLRILDPTMAFRLSGPAKKLYVQNVGSLAAVAGSVLSLAALAGADVETDARSSDFLKIKFGDTRYDILGGLQQNIVAAHRIMSGEKKSSQTGKVTALRGEDKPYGGDNPFTVLFDLIENKESPLLATGSRILRGEDRGGQPVNLAEEALGLVAPLAPREAVEQTIREGLPGTAKSLPGFVGIGTQTYGVQDINLSKSQKEYVDSIKDDKPKVEAVTRFYQYQKTAPDRVAASKAIKEALEANDLQKAVNIARQYNEQYKATFDDWRQQYKSYRNDEQLVKDYKSKLITERSFDRWLADIRR